MVIQTLHWKSFFLPYIWAYSLLVLKLSSYDFDQCTFFVSGEKEARDKRGYKHIFPSHHSCRQVSVSRCNSLADWLGRDTTTKNLKIQKFAQVEAKMSLLCQDMSTWSELMKTICSAFPTPPPTFPKPAKCPYWMHFFLALSSSLSPATVIESPLKFSAEQYGQHCIALQCCT